jgi:hypothetical protein
MRSRRIVALAAGLAALLPVTALAGAISVANVTANVTFTVTLGSCTCASAATNINAADWSDTTGTTTGWNGTLAVYQFVHTGAWAAVGASHALSSTAAGAYTGTTHDATYTVSVTSDGGTTVVLSWAGAETGSGTATKGSAFTVGTKGLTITFASGTTYANTDKYISRNDVLATSALVMAGAGTCVAGTGAVNAPTWTNTAATITGGTPTSLGTATKFLTSATNTGTGAWTCTPKATLSIDPNTGLAGNYTATAQYTIVSGP